MVLVACDCLPVQVEEGIRGMGSGVVLADAEVDPAGSEALAAAAAEGGAGAGVDVGVAAVEAVGPSLAAGARLDGIVFGVRPARLEPGEGRGAAQADAVPPADGAPVRVVGHGGADALAAALDAVAEAPMAFDLAYSMPILLWSIRFRLFALQLQLGLAGVARSAAGGIRDWRYSDHLRSCRSWLGTLRISVTHDFDWFTFWKNRRRVIKKAEHPATECVKAYILQMHPFGCGLTKYCHCVASFHLAPILVENRAHCSRNCRNIYQFHWLQNTRYLSSTYLNEGSESCEQESTSG